MANRVLDGRCPLGTAGSLTSPSAESGRVLNWWLYDGDKEHYVGSLAPEHRPLSVRVGWNHEMLVKRLERGWRPEMKSSARQ